MHEVMGSSRFTTTFRRQKVALGNSQPRYNSQVDGIRKKYYINTSRNSEQTPEWMARTQSNHYSTSMQKFSKNGDYGSPFRVVKQPNAYHDLNKPKNIGGQFQAVTKKKARSFWEMKNHTYELEWPKRQQKRQQFTSRTFANPEMSLTQGSAFHSRMHNSNFQSRTQDLAFQLPKYGIRQSPLHRQRATPLKIGHPATCDSIYIK